jgi:hypothetical protein
MIFLEIFYLQLGICKVVPVPGLKFWFYRDQNFQAGPGIFLLSKTRLDV